MSGFCTSPTGKIFSVKSAQRNLLQLDLYSNGMYGFWKSPSGKGFSGHTVKSARETFYSWTCIAVEYTVSKQVLLEKVSLVIL